MYQRIEHASELPSEWDELCRDNVYMSRHFMEHMEIANPCNQSYHLFYRDDKLYACFMMFERKFNLFIFTGKYDIPIQTKFIYLPLSVSDKSFVFTGDDMTEVERVLHSMKGTKIVINADEDDCLEGFHRGSYLPVCILENRWDTFDDYMASLRSGYRRRYSQALKKGKDIQFDVLDDNEDFTEQMYSLYEEVFNHSDYSLEKLNRKFFQNDISKVVTLSVDGEVLAIVQLIEDRINDTLIFEFGGYNYAKARQYDLYHNMLIYIVKHAIENGFGYVNFGQTAYDAKLKFGSTIHPKYFLLSHSNKLLNWVISKKVNFIEYALDDYDFHVFRDDEGEQQAT